MQDFADVSTEWLIDGFLHKESLNMIYADAGSGKSNFVIRLAVRLIEEHKVEKVRYYDGDNGKASLKERGLNEVIDKFKNNLEYFLEAAPKKYTLLDELLNEGELSNSLIIIDSIRNFILGDLREDKIVMPVLEKL